MGRDDEESLAILETRTNTRNAKPTCLQGVLAAGKNIMDEHGLVGRVQSLT